MDWYMWRKAVPLSVRRERARKETDKLRRKGVTVQPVKTEGRKIARSFWGQAWCEHLESFSEYWNRLPRGRSYLRHGLVCHLEIAKGEVKAIVSGNSLYQVHVTIRPLSRKKWGQVRQRCAGQIGSLLELLGGRLSNHVMAVVTDRSQGLFPSPGEITLQCSCPDWANMCKHVAAVLYGVGARLDQQPELLFKLRGVDHEELITADIGVASGSRGVEQDGRNIAEESLADVFGVEMAAAVSPGGSDSVRRRRKRAQGVGQTGRGSARGAVKRKAGVRNRGSKSSGGAPPHEQEDRVQASRDRQRPVSGLTVRKLRARLRMSQREFAELLGVSVQSITNWEARRGRLNLQNRTRAALIAAARSATATSRR